MTYSVTDFHGQVIAQYLTKDRAELLAINESIREQSYRAVRCEETGEKIVAFWPDGRVD